MKHVLYALLTLITLTQPLCAAHRPAAPEYDYNVDWKEEFKKALVTNFLDAHGFRSVNARNELLGTPLHIATKRGYALIARGLIARGADLNARTYLGSATPLHIAATQDDPKMAILLIEQGADVNARDDRKRSPLHRAAENGCGTIGYWLLYHDARVTAVDKAGNTPLHYAAKSDNDFLLCLLLVYYLENNGEQAHGYLHARNNDGETALHVAAEHNATKAAEILLRYGASWNARNQFDKTPLHTAAYHCNKEVAAVLLAYGADVNVMCRIRCTPLHSTQKSYKPTAEKDAMHRFLLAYGADAYRKTVYGYPQILGW